MLLHRKDREGTHHRAVERAKATTSETKPPHQTYSSERRQRGILRYEYLRRSGEYRQRTRKNKRQKLVLVGL